MSGGEGEGEGERGEASSHRDLRGSALEAREGAVVVRLLLVHQKGRVEHLEGVDVLQLLVAAEGVLSAERDGHEVVLGLDARAHLADPRLQGLMVVRGADLRGPRRLGEAICDAGRLIPGGRLGPGKG